MTTPRFEIKCDIQHVRRKWNAYVHAADTPTLRVYLYQNEKRWVVPANYTAKIGFGTDFEDSTELVVVEGVIGTDEPLNYFDFDFSGAETAISGDFFAQILVSDPTEEDNVVFGDGTLHILPSPMSGEYTPTTLTSTVNWDTITNIGTVPWPDEKDVIEIDCADSPITLTDIHIGKTMIMLASCTYDVEFILPETEVATNGNVFKFFNQSDKVLMVTSQTGDSIDEMVDANSIYSGEGLVNDNPPYASIRIKQMAVGTYHAVNGRLKWTYTS